MHDEQRAIMRAHLQQKGEQMKANAPASIQAELAACSNPAHRLPQAEFDKLADLAREGQAPYLTKAQEDWTYADYADSLGRIGYAEPPIGYTPTPGDDWHALEPIDPSLPRSVGLAILGILGGATVGIGAWLAYSWAWGWP